MESISNLLIAAVMLVMVTTGCKQSLVISQVNYAQPIESVLQPDEEGMVKDVRSGLSFNMLPLQYVETGDTTSVTTEQIRLIRGNEGFYFITAEGYKHVYVMTPEKSSLKLTNKLKIREEGILKPAFNQKGEHVQLLSRETGDYYTLTAKGIQQESNENS